MSHLKIKILLFIELRYKSYWKSVNDWDRRSMTLVTFDVLNEIILVFVPTKLEF